jgi:hypothetical protein
MTVESTDRMPTLGELNRTAYMRAATQGGDCWEAAAQAVADEAIRRHFASLPPGDEGLTEAFVKAAGWGPAYDAVPVRAGIAAVLDLHRRRVRERFSGTRWGEKEQEILDAEGWMSPGEMEADGWLSPDDVAKLRAEVAEDRKGDE